MRDFQRSKVYAWEQKYVAPMQSATLSIEKAELFVKGVWLSLGLAGPPIVELMPKQATQYFATGCRSRVRLRPVTPTWIVIHELAHALADDRHGANYMGIYIKLLDKVLGIPLPLSMFTLKETKIEYNLAAQPFFVNPGLKIL